MTNLTAIRPAAIDFKMADSIISELNCNLRDLSLEYGDVVISSGDISHELYYESSYNSHTLLGYVWVENDIYYTSIGNSNYHTPEQAAMDLLGTLATDARLVIEARKAAIDLPDYI